MTKTKCHLFFVSLVTTGPFADISENIYNKAISFCIIVLIVDYKELGLPYKARQFD